MKKTIINVTPSNKGWNVTGIQKTYTTKVDAISAGVRTGKANGNAELRIHNLDGKIADCRTYGSDPIPPRDK